jgi:gluconolactonase
VDQNPILDFGIDKASLEYMGEGLQRPECILAERDGTLWAADAPRRGGAPRGGRIAAHHHAAAVAGLRGGRERGFAPNGDILISNSGPTAWR